MDITEATIKALQGDLVEAKNPENDEINKKITKSLNGSTKYINDLKDAGLEVFQDEKGKVTAIGSPNKQGMTKADLKKAHPDTDYYNYMTKQKVEPEVVDTGAFAPTNMFRNSDNFEKTVGGHDTTYRQEDDNGVSRAIPKKYKTGRKNYGYNPDQFPKKDYTGVASYEPLTNKELNDFKTNKDKVAADSYLKQDLDKAKAEYEKIQAYYDEVNNQVQSVRDRIANSKSNNKTESKLVEDSIVLSNNGYDLTGDVDGYKVTKNGKVIKSLGRINRESAIMEFDAFVENNEADKIEEKCLREDMYEDNLKACIKNEDDKDVIKTWLDDLYNMAGDLEDKYYEMSDEVRLAVDNMFNETATPSYCIKWLISSVEDAREVIENINLDENN